MSNIVSSTIDESFPVAGQDNDSQGFRDNFQIIKTGLGVANTEITTLETNTAKKNAANDFAGNDIFDANLYQITQEHRDGLGSTLTGNTGFEWTDGSFNTVKVGGNISLISQGWATNDHYQEMIYQIYGDGNSTYTVTLTARYGSGLTSGMYIDGSGRLTDAGSSATISISATTTESQLVKAFTWDNGQKVFLQHLGTFSQV